MKRADYRLAALAYQRLYELESQPAARLAIDLELARCLFLSDDLKAASKSFERVIECTGFASTVWTFRRRSWSV